MRNWKKGENLFMRYGVDGDENEYFYVCSWE